MATGSTCGDIEAVDVTHGDWNKFRPIVGAWENFAKVYPGEFLTAHGADSSHEAAIALSSVDLSNGRINQTTQDTPISPRHKGAETVAWIANKKTRTQALVFRNEYLKQVLNFRMGLCLPAWAIASSLPYFVVVFALLFCPAQQARVC